MSVDGHCSVRQDQGMREANASLHQCFVPPTFLFGWLTSMFRVDAVSLTCESGV
jgi:hypothetical protein